ncbi:MAG: lysylphosphatidylglycerol synthase transmembrane domain-containing protein [Clostridia bacterium]|nr:lysylphosphatidylglycerol synthase transmembrane domain-containing protein [Clostridia bacterium]MDR3645102.1 lysylphosphatidylglycerol synthase transmembrane domain-containing protein [Clostridia bacterium]
MKNGLKCAVGFAVSIVIAYFALRDFGSFNPAQLLSSHINWWLAAASGCAFVASTWLRGLAYSDGIDRKMTRFTGWRITAVGNASNMLLPLKMGEGVRLALFPRGYSVLERGKLVMIPAAIDLAYILAEGTAAAMFAGYGSPGVVRILSTASLSFTVLLTGSVLVLLLLPRTSEATRRYLGADSLKMAFWVFVSWFAVLVSIWLGLLACGLGAGISVRYAAAAFAGMNLVLLIPASPGGIGLYEYSIIFALRGLGLALPAAKTAALLLHVTEYAFLLPLALAVWIVGLPAKRRSISARGMQSKTAAARAVNRR